MKFIVDAQLPPGLARALREVGCDAHPVREIGLREANDYEIWNYAIQQEAAIITKDEDFAERCLYRSLLTRKNHIARSGAHIAG